MKRTQASPKTPRNSRMSAAFPAPAELPDAPSAALSQRVRDAQTAMLYRRSQTSTLAGVMLAVLVCIGLEPYAQGDLVWGWFVLRCVVASFRYALGLRFFQSASTHGLLWRRAFITALAVDGLAWSLLGTLLLPQNQPHVQVLLVTVLVGVSCVAVFTLQPSWPASSTFLFTTLLPVAGYQLLSGSRPGLFGGLGLLLFVGMIFLELRHSEARIRELLGLRFDTDRIAEERAQALKLAQRQSHVKSQFLATMSHEMRTPLHGILGLTRMLQHNGRAPAGAPATQQLALIERAGEHLLTLINDVLDFSKLEAGQVKLSNEVFDLAALIEDVVSLSIPAAYEAGLNLTAKLQMARPCTVRGDPSRVRQVLHNLIGNAVKFTETGSVTVIAKYHTARGRARVAVHDTGVGIVPRDLARIFDAFQQADGSFTRRFGGTGLGLTIGRELARAMGGDLTCTSEVGKGSCFTVKVNLPAQETTPVLTLDLPLEPPVEVLHGHVLLAEDNLVNAIVAEAALQKIGLSVEVMGDGEQALAAFQRQQPDAVVLDCHMPVMDGFEAARRMREHERAAGWSRTPIIALTANALDGDREQSLAAGMDEHLAKPFREEQLRQALQRLLANRTRSSA
jgi:signal transduction histidine kinase/ActR/RegA family two-component response regulator